MNIWAIADLHLSFARPDRRERYAARWRDHATRIEAEWRTTVQPGDLVLMPGDLSMARNHRDVQPDMAWLDRLPGTKVLSAGNHDTWWNGANKIQPLLRRSLAAVGGNAVKLAGVIVCGTRGAPAENEPANPEVQALIDHELGELDRALDQARELQTDPGEPIYVLWHYPPFDRYGRPGAAATRLEQAGASACVYGHLHTEGQWARAAQGVIGGVRYYSVAADAIGFRPLRLGSW